MAALTAARIRPKLESIRCKQPKSRVIAFHAAGGWDGPQVIRLPEEEVRVVSCRSELAIRETLCARGEADPPLVILTPLEEAGLGEDVLARFAKRKLLRVDAWSSVRDLFAARDLDPRFTRHPWMAQALLDAAGESGVPPLPGGVLSLEGAWALLLDRCLGLAAERTDAAGLLRWAVGGGAGRYAAAPEPLREALPERLRESAGPVAGAILQCVAGGYGTDAIAIGLVFSVVFHDAAGSDVDLARASVHAEKFVGGASLSPGSGRRWAAAAESVVRGDLARGGIDAVAPVLSRADVLLHEVKAGRHAHLSTILRSGFEQRLEHFGAALADHLAGRSGLDTVAAGANAVMTHDLAPFDGRRVQRVRMAVRLCRYLAQTAALPESFAGAARHHAREGGFREWAVACLRGGDPQPTLSAACEALSRRVFARGEQEAKGFASLLSGWLEAGSSGGEVMPIEAVLQHVVAPLAGSVPALVLVLDGMNGAVFQELAAELTTPSAGWQALRPTNAGKKESIVLSALPVAAAIPTVTEVCRASLLCGKLTSGAQHAEKDGFGKNPALHEVSKAKYPPRLFHKGDLAAGGSDLPEEIRAEIVAPDRRIIAVVLNAVDDFLFKSDGIRPSWGLDYVTLLRPLLQAARDGGRAVVLTSDHGHILDQGSAGRKGAGSDRWRPFDGNAARDEIVLCGPRVAPAMGGKIIAPWSRAVRYGSKKNGYHGGAAPEEVIVPLGVFAPFEVEIKGWEPVAVANPDWWSAAVATEAPSPKPAAPREQRFEPLRARDGQRSLFERIPPAAPVAAAGPAWLDDLIASPVFAAQKELAGRMAPGETRVREFLLALDTRGGKLSRNALSQKLGLPLVRVQGTIVAMRKLLNADGYNVLGFDAASDTIELNVELLKKQFGIG